MPLTAFPNGVSSFGIPVIGSGSLVPVTTGSYFFVDSGAGSNANDGKSPTSAFSTVDYAIGKCTANKNDVIVLMPGHAETVTSTNVALDVAGVQIVGLGTGLKRPTFTYGAAAATITVSAANCSWSNCHFVGNFDNVTAAFTLGAAKDFVLSGNTFLDNSTALHFMSVLVTGTTDNAQDGLTIRGNSWWALAAAPAAFVAITADCDRLTIADNNVNMRSTDDEGSFLTLTGDTIRAALILRNTHIVLGSAGAAVGIFLTGSATDSDGVVAYNLVGSLDTTSELIATAGTKLTFFENYYTGTADASGKLWPAVDGA